MTRASTTFDPDPSSSPAVRHFVRDAVGESSVDDMDLLVLLASELASNAVLHARSPFTVTVQLDDGLVRVEVADEDPAPPVLRSPETSTPTGRGLRLVNDLALRWGVEPTGPGKTVWFELPARSTAATKEASR